MDDAAALFQVDAFTNDAFHGNPAAVCVLPTAAAADWMQQVAREMNLAETAFLHEEADGYWLRWFTPTDEVDLCGHATLASAHVLWTEGYVESSEQVRFHTKSGLLTARREGGWTTLDFPAEPAEETSAPAALVDAVRGAFGFVGRNRMDYLVLLEQEGDVRALQPDLTRLATLDARGVIVTAPSTSDEYDFVSRFFAPQVGVPEDPVTGSAHCCLAPFWRERLEKTTLVGYQASERGGVVRCRPQGERVELSGQAVMVLRGQLAVSYLAEEEF